MFQHLEVGQTLEQGSFGTIPSKIVRRTSIEESKFVSHNDMRKAGNIRKLTRGLTPTSTIDLDWLLKEDEHGMVDLNLCWATARLCPTKLIEVDIDCPSWKVFNAKLSQSHVFTTSIGYCPFLPNAPTNPAVVKEALQLCIKASSKLGMNHTVVTQDEAVYEISYTLRKNKPEDFPNLILRLGGFHLLMNYIGAIGKIMSGSGLKDMLVASEIVHEGTANKILAGRGYYQSVNAHMRAYEAMLYMWWSAFEDFCLANELQMSCFDEFNDRVNELDDNINGENKDAITALSDIKHFLEQTRPVIDKFNDSRSKYKLHQFWLNYIAMIETLLLYTHAEREGIWSEHLSATSKMAKIITAADHLKYTKVLVTYLEEMRNLPNQAPEIEREFQNGHFTVKRTPHKFNSIWTDMTLECSQNCDAKGRSGQAGLKGVTMKERTQEKWFVTLPFSASVTSSLKTMLKMDETENVHHEDNRAQENREYVQREAITDLFSADMINPFKYDECNDIVNIESGLKATGLVEKDLLEFEERGKSSVESYINTGKITKVKLHTCMELDKSVKPTKSKKQQNTYLTEELQVLKRALIERERDQSEATDLSDITSYELRSYPPSLAEVDKGTNEVNLRGGNKSSLLETLRKRSGIEKWPDTIPRLELDHKCVYVIDVMGVIRTVKPHESEDSETYAKRVFHTLVTRYKCSDLHLVADRYDGLYDIEDSSGGHVDLKDASGCRKRRKQSIKTYDIVKGHNLKHFDEILMNNSSKANLLSFLFETWLASGRGDIPPNTRVYLSGGFGNRLKAAVIDSNGECDMADDERELLTSTHEEADTRVFLHARLAAKLGCTRIVIRASDTDIVVIGLYLCNRLRELGVHELFIQTADYFIPVHDIANELSQSETNMLPFVHAISGCDTNGYIYGKGKRAFIKAIEPDTATEIASISTHLETAVHIDRQTIDNAIAIATAIFVRMYTRGKFENLDSLRSHLYYAGKKTLETLPPTDDALEQHVLRTIYQTAIWVRADQPTPTVIDPFAFGWTTADGVTKPVMMTRGHVPINLTKDTFCRCKKMCTRNCSCNKKGVKCENSCVCRGQLATCSRAHFEEEDVFEMSAM
ncbi:MAG: hypothetical protein ABW185_05305 [Sedimenticola sp.]